nr:aspartyl/asparaginyl beta-hydroxylase domain-containing protein [Lysobacter gilvus]
MAAFNEPHASVWYPSITKIPAAWSLARKVQRFAKAEKLGGVLLTRIRPGGQVKPHIDSGWHASHYRKFCVSIKADHNQAFCFDDCELRTVDGDVFEFRNDVTHWVPNQSARERISLIVCVR